MRNQREPQNILDGGKIAYSLIFQIFCGCLTAGYLVVSLHIFKNIYDPRQPVWIGLLVASFFLTVFIAGFLFFLETFRTLIYSNEGIVLYLPYRSKSSIQWSQITTVGYYKEQLSFSGLNTREVSVPINLFGVSSFLSFAEEHLNANVKEHYQYVLQAAQDAAQSAKPFL
jgi:hypothetical protein